MSLDKLNNKPKIEKMSDYKPPTASDALNASRVRPEYTPETPLDPVPESLVKAHAKMSLKAIKTYKSDAQEFIKRNKTTASDIIKTQNREKAGNVSKDSQQKTRFLKLTLLILISLGLIASGAFAIYLARKLSQQKPEPEPIKEAFHTDQTERIILNALSREGKLNSLIMATALNKKIGSIARIMPLEYAGAPNQISIARFFSLIAPSATSSAISRSLGKSYIFGIRHSLQDELILVFDIDNFENVFSGMLAWERWMFQDLRPIIPVKEQDSAPIVPKEAFQDEVLQNLDTRILRNSFGDIILIYTFYNKNALIITTSEDALKDILFRMTSFKLAQ
jgi:hypothetical protein